MTSQLLCGVSTIEQFISHEAKVKNSTQIWDSIQPMSFQNAQFLSISRKQETLTKSYTYSQDKHTYSSFGKTNCPIRKRQAVQTCTNWFVFSKEMSSLPALWFYGNRMFYVFPWWLPCVLLSIMIQTGTTKLKFLGQVK